jgi:hypothetical protein
MRSIKLALSVHHDALRRTRGVECLYYRKGETEAVEFLLVPGRTSADEVGEIDAAQSGRTRDWLELREHLEIKLGRMPAADDQIVELNERGEPARTWAIAKVGNSREYADHDTHGVVVRFHSVETKPKR